MTWNVWQSFMGRCLRMKYELFSEVYNCYYLVVRKILDDAAHKTLSEKDISAAAVKYGYEESSLAIVPKLLDGEWNLLVKDHDGYKSKVSAPGPLPFTRLQKAWLRTLLADARFRLFFSDDACADLKTYTADTEPLFSWEDFWYFDRYADGDPVGSAMYRNHFQTLLKGIHESRIIEIEYYSRKGRISSRCCIPCRIEYSTKDDKFRLQAVTVHQDGQMSGPLILNIARILQIRDSGKRAKIQPEIDQYLEESLCPEPVVLEISNERNALERTMLHFACYRKQTERLGDSGKYLCRIYYREEMEAELLIQILSFGPVVKVLGPERFLDQIRSRVRRQAILTERLTAQILPGSSKDAPS